LHLYLSASDSFHRISLRIWLFPFCSTHFRDCLSTTTNGHFNWISNPPIFDRVFFSIKSL
jgi:hypothetical protein